MNNTEISLVEYQKLVQTAEEFNYHYYALDEPIVSDAQYDALIAKLKRIEEVHPEWILKESPTQRVSGQAMDKFNKVNHPAPILSLANAFDEQGVKAWYERIRKLDKRVERSSFVVEPKIDGLTVVLNYENGIFTQGATRGDGIIGEDVTANLRTIRSIPLRLRSGEADQSIPERIVVRGEAYISLSDFEDLNEQLIEKGEKPYLNPRNTAAGSLRQLNPGLTAARPLSIFTYAIVEYNGLNEPRTQWDLLLSLKRMGFPISDVARCFNTLDDAITYCHQIGDVRDNIPFEIDGMVIKLNDLAVAQDLGIAGKDPRGALAYKFPARESSTKLVDIRVNVGRTGVLTPYAVLDPVEIGGVVVRQATLHNFDYIAEKDIRIGDRVMVKRAGDVIPYVIGPITGERNGSEPVYIPPDKCPECGSPSEHLNGEVAWYCINPKCPAQLVRNLEHFVSREAMDINGLGIKVVEQLVEAGYLKDSADLYKLTSDELLKLEGFAEKKAENLLNSIAISRTRPLERFINALGIHGVGEVSAADLARRFTTLDKLIQASESDLQQIAGVGPNTAASIIHWFQRRENLDLIDKFRSLGIDPHSEIENKSDQPGKFSGLVFVVTGTLTGFSRDGVKEYIESYGGKVTDNVSAKTNYLVLGENPGSKLERAKALGIPIIDEIELRKLGEE